MIKNLFDLKGKTALVTGSSRGIGLTLARGLAMAGASVVLNGRNEEKLLACAAAFKKEGLNAVVSAFDVCKEAAVQERIREIEEQAGGLDILINNAGNQFRAPLERFTENEWRALLDVHLTGAFLVSKTVVQAMIRKRSGKIINVCSVQSELARPGIAPYAVAKGGLKMLTRSMAAEWGPYGIQVNGIAPGYFKTEITRPLYEDPVFDGWLRNRTPARRWGESEELVGAAVFLASAASSYVNGHVLFVDGGLSVCV